MAYRVFWTQIQRGNAQRLKIKADDIATAQALSRILHDSGPFPVITDIEIIDRETGDQIKGERN